MAEKRGASSNLSTQIWFDMYLNSLLGTYGVGPEPYVDLHMICFDNRVVVHGSTKTAEARHDVFPSKWFGGHIKKKQGIWGDACMIQLYTWQTLLMCHVLSLESLEFAIGLKGANGVYIYIYHKSSCDAALCR